MLGKSFSGKVIRKPKASLYDVSDKQWIKGRTTGYSNHAHFVSWIRKKITKLCV